MKTLTIQTEVIDVEVFTKAVIVKRNSKVVREVLRGEVLESDVLQVFSKAVDLSRKVKKVDTVTKISSTIEVITSKYSF